MFYRNVILTVKGKFEMLLSLDAPMSLRLKEMK